MGHIPMARYDSRINTELWLNVHAVYDLNRGRDARQV